MFLIYRLIKNKFEKMYSVGSYNASVKFHSRLVHSLLRSHMAFFERTPAGRILNRLSNVWDLKKIFFERYCQNWSMTNSQKKTKAGRKLSSYFGVVPLYLSVVPWYDKKYDNLRSRVVLFSAFWMKKYDNLRLHAVVRQLAVGLTSRITWFCGTGLVSGAPQDWFKPRLRPKDFA